MAGRSNYRPLLPQISDASSSSNGAGTPNSSTEPDARSAPRTVRTACLECRRRKIRCDGGRPVCGNCTTHGLQCVYDRDPDTTPIADLRRRHDELVTQNAQMMELYNTLRTRPESDAEEILKRIRATDDLDQVLQLIRAGVTLASILGPQQAEEQPVALPRRLGGSQHSQWTNIAGHELVEELIGSFLSDDHPYFLAFIDKECFLFDFRSNNQNDSRYCSQLLVNAICAVACFSSNTVKLLDAHHSIRLREQFSHEAERLLDLPNTNGSASLPTVQAFYLMILYESAFGKDRTTLTERCRAFATVRRQSIDSHYFPGGHLPNQTVSRDQRAVSTIIWSSFCAQSLKAMCYMVKPQLRVPTIARYFEHVHLDDGTNGERRVDGSARLLGAICELSVIIHQELLQLPNEISPIGSANDIQKRLRLYGILLETRRTLPEDLKWNSRSTLQNLYLSNYIDHAIITLMRVLPWDYQLRLAEGPTTAGHICRFYCEKNIGDLQDHELRISGRMDPLTPLYAPYQPCTVALTLVAHLGSVDTHDGFTRACRSLWRDSSIYPFATSTLAAIMTSARKFRVVLPPASIPYFENIEFDTSPNTNHLEPVLPYYLEMVTSFTEGSEETGLHVGPQIGELIEKWNQVSL